MADSRQVILVVDDTPDNITLVSSLLKDKYKVKIATNGEKALKVARESPPDLILLDIMMPVMDGYETCRQLKMDDKLKNIPIIFLTAKAEIEDESKGFELGAVDYIVKPISPAILIARVKTHLNLKQVQDFFIDKNEYLEKEVSRRTKEIFLMQEVSIMSMASLAEIRDNETGYHIKRTKLYVNLLANLLKENLKYAGLLNQENIDLITISAPLHDIGKVGISDNILLKPGKLTKEEFEIMKTHASLGREAIERAEKLIDKSETFLKFAKEIASSHHERWDGNGYPNRLKGEEIPISARIMAVADVYDALVSKRVYKEAFSNDDAVKIISDEAGKQFDPEIVKVFIENKEKFREISEIYE